MLCPQVRTTSGFDEMFERHVQEHRMHAGHIGGFAGGGPAPQPPRFDAAAEVSCGMCQSRFDVPLSPVVDVTKSTYNYLPNGIPDRSPPTLQQLFCCEECARTKSCWGQVWGLGDGSSREDQEEADNPMETA
jgi:hypothetical protein